MMFTSTKIFLDSETVAEQLRSARQTKNLKLKDIAEKLNINYKYLEALERGNLEELPSGVYGKNFLREYASFLGLDDEELLKIFERETAVRQGSGRAELFSRQTARSRHFLAMPKILRNSLVASIVIICLIYLGYRLDKIISPPKLIITSPIENLITTERSIKVEGTTENEAQITINGEQILSDTRGNFLKEINLKNGINIIAITAKKKYGRENTIIRQVLVRE